MKKFILSLLSIITFTYIANAQLTDWQFKKALNVTERSGNNLTNYQVLLHINTAELIQANQLNADASDLRFATDCEGTNVVPHYIEKDTNSTNAFVWVLMDLPANSNTPLFMFYGNPTATSNAVFEEVFINNFILETGVEVNLQDTELNFDWFEIKAGTEFTLSPLHEGKLKINARRIIIDGNVVGDSLGYKGVVAGDGAGPGGGKVGDNGGGGGYGGAGSDGEFVNGLGGPGGQAYGDAFSINIDAGSAGGASDVLWDPFPGGNGGAGFWFNGTYTTITGNISCNGGQPLVNSQNYVAGPGSGGGVLVTSDVCDFTGDIKAEGAHAISDVAGIYWSSGAGGGGRVKLFYESDLTNTGSISVRQGFTLSSNTVEGEVGTIFISGDSTLTFPKASAPTDIATNVVLATQSGATDLCDGDSLTLTATAGFTSYNFLLNGDSVTTSSNNQVTIGGITDGDKLSVIASSFGCTTISNEIEISIIPAITADFTANGNGTIFNFTNGSQNGTDYFWEFGDGSTSTIENPTYTYASVDTFTVCLTTSNSNGCPSANYCTDVIATCNPPIANQILATLGLQLNGIDSSLYGTNSTWYVDGQIVSTDSVFNYSFNTAGNYEVCLVSNNFCGQDSICQNLAVCELPVSLFSEEINGTTVAFTDSSLSATTWEWDFGNGETFTGANPNNVVYADSNATYTVCLTTTNDCNEQDVFCQDILITGTTNIVKQQFNNLVIFPNPANDVLTLKNSIGGTEYYIINISGASIKKGILEEGETKINLSDIDAGTYFIKILAKHQYTIERISIIH